MCRARSGPAPLPLRPVRDRERRARLLENHCGFTPSDLAIANGHQDVADAILLDSFRAGGTGTLADLDHCKDVVALSPLPVFLAGGLTPDNVGAAIEHVKPFGVDVETGVSDRIPGGPLIKNLDKCMRFMNAVRTNDVRTGRV